LFFLRRTILSHLKTYNLYYDGKNLQLRHREVRNRFTLIVWQVGERLTPSVLSQLFTIVWGVITVCDWRGCSCRASLCLSVSLLRCSGCAKLLTDLDMLHSSTSFILKVILRSVMYPHLFLSGNKLKDKYMYGVCIVPAGRGGADHRRTSQYLMGFASTNQASDAG